MAKLDNNFTLHLDNETRELVERLASYYSRKPCELLRLILVPQLVQEWAKVQRVEHQENLAAPTIATFKNKEFIK